MCRREDARAKRARYPKDQGFNTSPKPPQTLQSLGLGCKGPDKTRTPNPKPKNNKNLNSQKEEKAYMGLESFFFGEGGGGYMIVSCIGTRTTTSSSYVEKTPNKVMVREKMRTMRAHVAKMSELFHEAAPRLQNDTKRPSASL